MIMAHDLYKGPKGKGKDAGHMPWKGHYKKKSRTVLKIGIVAQS
jgi:hypothetical protein